MQDRHGTHGQFASTGTCDLEFSHETIKRNILAKAGWPQLAKRQYPYVVDTSLKVLHVDRDSGVTYPKVWPTSKPKPLKLRA